MIAWGAFGILVVLAIALANLSGLTGNTPPSNDTAAQAPALVWNAPVAQPIATADAADTAGQNVDQDDPPATTPATKAPAAKAPAAKPKSTSAPEPAAKPATAPKPPAIPGDQGLVLPGTRCQDKHHRGHTADGSDVRCTRKHRNDDLRWQPPRTNQESSFSRPRGATGYDNQQRSSSNQNRRDAPPANNPWHW
jgi:hypothetical protein